MSRLHDSENYGPYPPKNKALRSSSRPHPSTARARALEQQSPGPCRGHATSATRAVCCATRATWAAGLEGGEASGALWLLRYHRHVISGGEHCGGTAQATRVGPCGGCCPLHKGKHALPHHVFDDPAGGQHLAICRDHTLLLLRTGAHSVVLGLASSLWTKADASWTLAFPGSSAYVVIVEGMHMHTHSWKESVTPMEGGCK